MGVATCHGESPSAMHSLQGCWFRVEWKKFNISSLCSFFEKNLEENPVSYPSIALLRPRHDHVTKLGFRWFFRIVFTEGASSSCSLCSALHSTPGGQWLAKQKHVDCEQMVLFSTEKRSVNGFFLPCSFSATFCSELYFYFCDDTCRAGNAY